MKSKSMIRPVIHPQAASASLAPKHIPPIVSRKKYNNGIRVFLHAPAAVIVGSIPRAFLQKRATDGNYRRGLRVDPGRHGLLSEAWVLQNAAATYPSGSNQGRWRAILCR